MISTFCRKFDYSHSASSKGGDIICLFNFIMKCYYKTTFSAVSSTNSPFPLYQPYTDYPNHFYLSSISARKWNVLKVLSRPSFCAFLAH